MTDGALDPLRSTGQVWGVLRARPGPMVAWWGGGTLFGVCLTGAAALVDLPPKQEPWLYMAWFGALLLGGIAWRVGLARVLETALEPGAGRPGGSFAVRFLNVCATLVVLALALLLVSLPFVAALVLLLQVDEPRPLLQATLLVLWGTVLLHVALGLSLAPFAAAVEDAGPLALLLRSWRLARRRRLALAGFWLATLALSLSGLVALGVGVLATGALLHLLPTEAWLALRREAKVEPVT